MEKPENKKIYLKKTDSAAAVIQKILNSRESKVILAVPRYSLLGENGNNFI